MQQPCQNIFCKIAVDVMGGDNDPEASIKGIVKALGDYSGLSVILFGDSIRIKSLLESNINKFADRIEIVHTDKVINPYDKPSVALRRSANTSLRLAIEAVKSAQADAVVSSGSTGTLLAIARVVLRTLPQIAKPGIVATMPTVKGTSVAFIDAGGNAECNEDMLFNFAIMGDAFARIMFKLDRPRVALLNIGIEDIKGTEFIKNTMNKFKNANGIINLHGYVEGDGIIDGSADVVVSDGFTGNVALKAIEGTAKFCEQIFKIGFSSSWMSKIGYLLAKKSLKRAFEKIDRRIHNGAMFIGVNGIVVKSHGSADSIAFYHAIKTAIDLVANNINGKIVEELDSYKLAEHNNE